MDGESTTTEVQDCAVCLQKCHYPTQLPCGHIFCFLCVKGVAIQSKKCAMCRAEIPPDYLDHPILLEKILTEQASTRTIEEFQWYYEGRNGWWKYDERSNNELESAFNAGDVECKLLLAGALYCVNFQNMIQVQSRDPTRRRRVRRDTPTLPAKGIAGIKIPDTRNSAQTKIEENSNSNLNPDVVVIEDSDDDADDNNESVSPQDRSISEVLERISSIDLQEPTSSDNTSATEEM